MNEKVDNLKQQSDNLNERLKKAEQEKEHWKVEYQLVQMKHDKLKDKFEGKKYVIFVVDRGFQIKGI